MQITCGIHLTDHKLTFLFPAKSQASTDLGAKCGLGRRTGARPSFGLPALYNKAINADPGLVGLRDCSTGGVSVN